MKLEDHPTVQRIRLKTVEGQPSRTLRWDEVVAWQPEVVFIACCGFGVERTLADVPLLQTVPAWLDLPAVRSGRIYVTDGSQYFNRPGPRLVDSLGDPGARAGFRRLSATRRLAAAG